MCLERVVSNMEVFGLEITPTLGLSLWGAALSTILGVFKIKEYMEARFKVGTSYVWRSDEYLGNDIVVQNLSSKPVLLDYMEVFYIKKSGWFKKEKVVLWSPEDETLNIKIDSLAGEKFTFNESNYFSTTGKEIYLQLFFAGKKAIEKSVG